MIRGLIIGQTPPPENGSSRMAILLVETLTYLGFEINVVSKDFSKNSGEIGKKYLAKSFALPKLFKKVSFNLRKNPQFVVLFLTSRIPSLIVDVFLFWIAQRKNRKVVLYIHTMGFSSLTKRSFLLALVLKRVFSKATAVVTLGAAMEQDIKAVAPHCRTVNIPNCVLPKSSKENKAAEFSTRRQVLFVSNMANSKGIDTFLSVFGSLARQNKDICATIVGQPLYENQIAEIQSALLNSEWSNRVKFLGYQKREVISDLFQGSLFLLYPSREDAQPLVILEALAVGLPVVASNVGMIPEILQNGSGFTFDPGDIEGMLKACENLIEDKLLWESTVTKAVQAYEARYNMEIFRSNWSLFLVGLLEIDAKH
jgi:glycosyltransferase involved in cell wall biosynthesis